MTLLYSLKEVVEKNLKKVVTLSEKIGEGIDDDEEFATHLDESMNIELKINHKLAILNEFITKKKLVTISRLPEISRLSTASTSNSHNEKLPKFQIKVFSGKDPPEWRSFYESPLEDMVKNLSLADTEKK